MPTSKHVTEGVDSFTLRYPMRFGVSAVLVVLTAVMILCAVLADDWQWILFGAGAGVLLLAIRRVLGASITLNNKGISSSDFGLSRRTLTWTEVDGFVKVGTFEQIGVRLRSGKEIPLMSYSSLDGFTNDDAIRALNGQRQKLDPAI